MKIGALRSHISLANQPPMGQRILFRIFCSSVSRMWRFSHNKQTWLGDFLPIWAMDGVSLHTPCVSVSARATVSCCPFSTTHMPSDSLTRLILFLTLRILGVPLALDLSVLSVYCLIRSSMCTYMYITHREPICHAVVYIIFGMDSARKGWRNAYVFVYFVLFFLSFFVLFVFVIRVSQSG